jgi:hypothetical protein
MSNACDRYTAEIVQLFVGHISSRQFKDIECMSENQTCLIQKMRLIWFDPETCSDPGLDAS